MTWEQRRGVLKLIAGTLKAGWARLTDDDRLLLDAKRAVFVGKLEARSGRARQAAEEQLDALLSRIGERKRAHAPGSSLPAEWLRAGKLVD